MNTAPKHLKDSGRAFWKSIIAEYQIEDAAGQSLLARACECLDRLRQAQADIERDGATVLDRYGSPKAHPATGIEKDSRNGFFAALRQLQLDIEPLKDATGRPPENYAWKGE